jgi:molecular chaperone GrpE
MMSFDDIFGSFMTDRGRGSKQRVSGSRTVSLSREEYEVLRAKAERYEALVEEHKKVKKWNDQLLKEMDDLKEDAREFKKLQEERDKFMQSLLQVRADFDNYRKRSERENARRREYALEDFLRKLLGHYDDMERTLNTLRMLEGTEGVQKGFEIVFNNFRKLLEAEGVRPMESEGTKFDPYKHEAMLVEENRDDVPENTIVEVLDKGYYLKDRVLRPAKVKISKRPRVEVEIEVKN